MKLYRLIILAIFFTLPVYTQYPCFRIFPSSVNQIEPSITKNPLNQQIMFAGSYTINGSNISEGVYTTTNGGVSWTGTDLFPGTPSPTHNGDPGPIIDKNGIFIFTHLGSGSPGMYSNYSTDNGNTWSSPNYVIATQDQDKGHPNTDAVLSSSFYGRSYLAWTRFTSPFPIVISYTTNGGVSWSSFAQINNSFAGHLSQGAEVSIGPNGQVYVCWAASITTSPFNEDKIGFASSTNGGVSWNVNEQAYDCNGIKTNQQAPWNIRLNGYPFMDVDKTGGARDGWIYIVTGEKNLAPAGSDPDIIFHRSTDGGTTWSAGVRVNQDGLNNGKVQYFPYPVVDPTGAINVVYNDGRNGTPQDSLIQVYLSRSTDGGDTWHDYRISDHSFVPKSINVTGAGNQGDNIGMTFANGKLWPVWMDRSTGNYQIWTTGIDINTIGIQTISTEVPSSFSLSQNYPNPFNPNTIIKFQIAKLSDSRLIIYNALGQEISTLVNQQLKPGTYSVEWNSGNSLSGVYFYKLVVGDNNNRNFIETKKMILIK